jgi:hypothetical protein
MKNIFIFAVVGFFVFGAGIVRASAQEKRESKLNVGILIFNGVQIIDYTGPYEVLGSHGKRSVFTVAESRKP